MKSTIQKLLLCVYFIAPAAFGQFSNIIIGGSPNNEDGDPPRTAYIKINSSISAVAKNGGMTFYVRPWGNDTNNGLTEFTPFASPLFAATAATAGDVVDAGYELNSNGVNQAVIQLNPGVTWNGGNLVLSNSSPGDASHASFRLNANCTVNNLTIRFLDSQADSDCPFGLGTADGALNCSNCIVNNLRLWSDGTGIHFEGLATGTGSSIVFNNPWVLANDNCLEFKRCPQFSLTVNNPTFILTNYYNASTTVAKPLRVIESESGTGSIMRINGGDVWYSDTLNSTNFAGPNYCNVFWSAAGLAGQSNCIVTGMVLHPISVTNVNTFDFFGVTTNTYFVNGVSRSDGKALTETNTGPKSCIIYPTLTLSQTNAAPGSGTAIDWVSVVVGGQTYKMPLMQ